MIQSYCINLDRQFNRWLHFKENVSSKLNDFNIERLSAIPLNEVSIKEKTINKSLSHRLQRRACEMSNLESFGTAIKKAKERNLPYVAVFEDDCYIKYEYKSNMIQNIISNELCGVEWGVLYLGCYVKSSTKGTFSKFSNNLLKFNNDKTYSIWGAHAIVYNSRVFDDFIGYVFNDQGVYKYITDPFVNHVLCKKHQAFILNPPLIYQHKAFLAGSSMHGRFNFDMLERECEGILKERLV